MSRYIDADELQDFVFRYGGNATSDDFIKWIEQTETADVVEVVRCKDCKHNYMKSWNQGKRDKPRCHFTDLIRSNEFYCGFGERGRQ